MSTAVLELLGDEHRITNASWLSPGQQSVALPTGALGSKILCERHNRALSTLDAHAKTFFNELLWGLSDGPPHAPYRRAEVRGEQVELWLLKACCGAFASGNLVDRGRAIPRQPPEAWLNLLFCGARWEAGTGMHVRQAALNPHSGYSIGPVHAGDTCAGGGIEFAGIELFLLLDGSADKRILEQSASQFSALIYRPGAIRIESPARTMEVRLQWQT